MKKIKNFFNEFKKFATKGNVVDLAVAVIIGGAFQSIITSLVNDIISPLIGCFAKTDFSNFSIKFGDAEIRYGAFITAVINFLIIAFVIFILIKWINKIMELAAKLERKKEEEVKPAEPTTKICPYCMSEISIKATRCPHCTSELESK